MTLLLARADARALPPADESVQCVVTSPPYLGLRDYKSDGQIGLESTPEEYIAHIVETMSECRRVLRADGVLWLNLGDFYGRSQETNVPQTKWAPNAYPVHDKSGSSDGATGRGERPGARGEGFGVRPKDLCMMPARVALALQADGWYVRSQIPWVKRSCLPESVTDRPTNAIEYVYLLTKSAFYFYDAEAVRMPSSQKPQRRAIPHKKRDAMADGQPVQTYSTSEAREEPAQDSADGRRNRRTSDWFFESWQGLASDDEGDPLALVVNPRPYKGSHYATFPEQLVEPMIRAGTSEHGCCARCGAPWARILEEPDFTQQPRRVACKPEGELQSHGENFLTSAGQQWQEWRNAHPNRTTGWQPTCKCDCPDVKPCLVLDPFCGTAVTGRVAIRLRRRAVCFDLSATYLRDLATRRTTNVQVELPGVAP